MGIPDVKKAYGGDGKSKKRKRASENVNSSDSPTSYSTIVFAATKHRVEYLVDLLQSAGYRVSYGMVNL